MDMFQPPATTSMECLAVLWEWTDGPHKGARFYAIHAFPDGRLSDWPQRDLKPVGAAKVFVEADKGMDLIAAFAMAR